VELGRHPWRAHDAILVGDRDLTIRGWNPAAERLYGWTAAEAVGRSFTMLVPPDRRRNAQAIFDRLLVEGAPISKQGDTMRKGRG
jgi:PAS domain S-box-containing protein